MSQKLNASMEEQGKTSELGDGEDDHHIKNDDKLEGNSLSNCDLSHFKDKAFFLMFEDNGSHCNNIIGRIGGLPWVKRDSSNAFDVPMGSYDGAKIWNSSVCLSSQSLKKHSSTA